MFVMFALIVIFYAMYYTGASNWRTNGAAQMTLAKAIGIPQAVTHLLSTTKGTDQPPAIKLSPQAQSIVDQSVNTGGSLGQSIQGGQIGVT